VDKARLRLRDACDAFAEEMASIEDDWMVGSIAERERHDRLTRAASASEAAFAAYDERLRWENVPLRHVAVEVSIQAYVTALEWWRENYPELD
jgi:hypothetical protein